MSRQMINLNQSYFYSYSFSLDIIYFLDDYNFFITTNKYLIIFYFLIIWLMIF